MDVKIDVGDDKNVLFIMPEADIFIDFSAKNAAIVGRALIKVAYKADPTIFKAEEEKDSKYKKGV